MADKVTLTLTTDQIKALIELLGPIDQIKVAPDKGDELIKILSDALGA